jgi:HK97 family phage prohead protease
MMLKEIRIAKIEINADTQGEMILEGYAATFEQPTVLYAFDGIEHKEVIDRNAFNTADFKDCCLKYNHQDSVPILARTRGNSLELKVDDVGLFFRAKLFDTSISRDVYKLVQEGGLDKCSFAFTVAEDGDEYDRTPTTRMRRITKIEKLWDCSIVDVPAYDSTVVSARNYFSAKEEEIENREYDERKKRLALIASL